MLVSQDIMLENCVKQIQYLISAFCHHVKASCHILVSIMYKIDKVYEVFTFFSLKQRKIGFG